MAAPRNGKQPASTSKHLNKPREKTKKNDADYQQD
jgi:hypothetical protein